MAIFKIWDGSSWVEVPIEDPTLYMRHDGSVAMTGPLDMGGNAIVSVDTVDGRDVSADGGVLDAHLAATSDPHGAIMGISTRLETPEVRSVGVDLTLEAFDPTSNRVVYVKNTGAGKVADLNVERHVIVGGAAAYDVVYDNGDVNGNIVIDWTNGNVQKITLDGNVTQVLFTNPPGPCNCRLWIYQDADGTRTIADNWDADVKWGGTAPVISTGNANFNVGVFEYDGGSTYAAQIAQGIDGLGFKPP